MKNKSLGDAAFNEYWTSSIWPKAQFWFQLFIKMLFYKRLCAFCELSILRTSALHYAACHVFRYIA